jgi:CDP-6-deoxy-D-xylo-4-hexulose-3-dehydrase
MQNVIDSGIYTMGTHVAEFEQQFAQLVGSSYCVMVNSGSSANLAMIAGLFYRKAGCLKRGDEVIVPAISWSTTYYPLYQYGLRLKFVDVDLESLNYDLEALAAAVSEGTRAIMVVNLLGNPNDFDAIRQIISGHDILLLEDNCESLGARFGGRQAGTHGLMGTYSAFFSHHISTMEGGMVVTEDEELYHILLSLRAHGWTRNLPKHNHVCETKSDDYFAESFRFVLPGYNLRPLEISGAIGKEQIRKLHEFVRVRRENAVKFKALMREFPEFMTQREIGESSWFGFSLVISPGASFSRQDLVRVFDEKKIECRPVVAGNFAKNEVVRWFDSTVHGELKNAEYIDSHGLFVGNHHYPLDRQFVLLRETLLTLRTMW